MVEPVKSTAITEPRMRWIHELLFSLNLAWLGVWYTRVCSRPSFSWLYAFPVVQYSYWHTRHVEPETVLVQVFWSLIFGVAIFTIFRTLDRVWPTWLVLRAIGGVFALGGFSFLALIFRSSFLEPQRIGHYAMLLTLELIVVLICGALFYLRKCGFSPHRLSYCCFCTSSRGHGLWAVGLILCGSCMCTVS